MSDLHEPPAGVESAVRVDTWRGLDAACAAAGVVGDTYPTGEPGYGARRACAVIGGRLHDAPALYDATHGSWPWPGYTPVRFTPDEHRRADEAAERADEHRLRGFDTRRA